MTIASFDVDKTLPFVGQWPKGFGEQTERSNIDRELTFVSGHHHAVCFNKVTHIEIFGARDLQFSHAHKSIRLAFFFLGFGIGVDSEIELHFTRAITKSDEGGFAKRTEKNYATSDVNVDAASEQFVLIVVAIGELPFVVAATS